MPTSSLHRGRGICAERRVAVLDDLASLSRRAAELIAEQRPKAIALAGGRTPQQTYERLAEHDLSWEQIDVFLTDERCVPLDDIRSNWRMISEALLQRVPARGHPVNVDLDPDRAAAEYGAQIIAHMPLDLVVLGLGEDGHTASLFPGSDALDSKAAAAAARAPDGTDRVGLTFGTINSARVVVFLVAGEDKADVLRRFLDGADLPAQRVSPRETLWVMTDQSAAG